MARFAVFEDDTVLFFPLVAHIGTTTIEMLFTGVHGGPVTERDSETGEIRLANRWHADRVRFRVTHELSANRDPGTSALVRNAREWWGPFSGKRITEPRGWRPRKEIPYRVVAAVWRGMREEAAYIDTNPTDRELRDRLHHVTGETWSQDTLKRRKDEWIEKGHSWPPQTDS